MRLISCCIENFGKLKNKEFDLSKKFIEIKQDNSWGKTTLANFISAMFYGLPDKKDKKFTNHRLLYDPWQGGNFGGNLIFELDGKQYQIERNFNKKDDDFKLVEVATQKSVEKIGKEAIDCKNFGDVLFGIGRISYERSAYIPQGDIIAEKIETDLNEKLRNLVNATDENNNLNKAAKTLDEAAKKIESPRGGGKLKEFDIKIYDINSKIDECEACAYNAEEDRESLKNYNEELKICLKEMQELDNDIAKAGKMELLREQRESYRRLNESVDESQKLAQQVKDFANANIDDIKRKIDKVYEIEKAISQEKLRVAGAKRQRTGFLFILLCIITFGIALLFKRKPTKEPYLKELSGQFQAANLEAERILSSFKCVEQDMQAQYFEIKQKYEQYNIFNQSFLDAKFKLSEFLSDKDEEKLKNDFINGQPLELLNFNKRKLENRKNELIEEIARLKVSIDKNEANAADVEDYKAELFNIKEQRKKLSATLEIVKKAKELLISASENLAEEYIAPLKVKCCELISFFDADKAEVVFDCDANVLIKGEGKFRQLGFFSYGNKELISLCMRFALVDAIFKEKDRKPCVILDDPFVNLDNKKLELAKDFIKKLANDYQIIYLTCHDSRKIG